MNTQDFIATLPPNTATLDPDRRDFLLKSATGLTVVASVGPTALAANAPSTFATSSGADNFYRSAQFSEQAVSFKDQYGMRVAGNLFNPKELHVVSKAGHVDLYDRVTLIPFDKLTSFFNNHLVVASA